MVSFAETLENALQIAKNISGDEIPKAIAFAVKAYAAKEFVFEFLFTTVSLGCMAYIVYRLIYCLTRSGGE